MRTPSIQRCVAASETVMMVTLDASALRRGIAAFREREPRDAMYRIASFLVSHFWGDAREMANALGVLLLTWNQAFYRFGPFDYAALEECIARNQEVLDSFRSRDILTYSPADDGSVTHLYEQFLEALGIVEGNCAGRRSPVGVAKALHLLAPAFFPLWDAEIARAYGCHYTYIPFIRRMKELAELLAPEIDARSTDKTLLKLIDEYNYARFTKGWV